MVVEPQKIWTCGMLQHWADAECLKVLGVADKGLFPATTLSLGSVCFSFRTETVLSVQLSPIPRRVPSWSVAGLLLSLCWSLCPSAGEKGPSAGQAQWAQHADGGVFWWLAHLHRCWVTKGHKEVHCGFEDKTFLDSFLHFPFLTCVGIKLHTAAHDPVYLIWIREEISLQQIWVFFPKDGQNMSISFCVDSV